MLLTPSNPLVRSCAVGTVLQLAMVIAGHFSPGIASRFAFVGTGISALSGLLFALWTKQLPPGATVGGGIVAGGLPAALGIGASLLLKDVAPSTLGIGTAASAVAGAVGGLLGRLFTGPARA
jgi:hypothetical protein